MAIRPELTLRTNISDNLEKTSLFCILNQARFNMQQGWLSLGRTLFICLLLVILISFFNKDIEKLIVQPIEKMIHKLKIMAEDP